LLSLVDLLDESIDGFAGLDGDVFILVEEIGVELIEECDIMLGGDEISLEYLKHQYFVLGGVLVFDEGGEEAVDHLFLEG
jgi:hypothetical protein